MVSLLDAIAAVGPAPDRRAGRPARSTASSSAGRATGPAAPELGADVLRLGVLAWTRLHGLVSLEIEGAFASMELDPGLLFAAEVDQLITERSAG